MTSDNVAYAYTARGVKMTTQLFIGGTVVGVVMALVIGLENRDQAGLGFLAAFGIVFLGMLRWFLGRTAFHARVTTDGTLHWRSLCVSGSTHVADVVGITPHPGGSSVHRIVLAQGRPIWVWSTKGFVQFAAALQVDAPAATIRIGPYARIANRLPGPSGFRELDPSATR